MTQSHEMGTAPADRAEFRPTRHLYVKDVVYQGKTLGSLQVHPDEQPWKLVLAESPTIVDIPLSVLEDILRVKRDIEYSREHSRVEVLAFAAGALYRHTSAEEKAKAEEERAKFKEAGIGPVTAHIEEEALGLKVELFDETPDSPGTIVAYVFGRDDKLISRQTFENRQAVVDTFGQMKLYSVTDKSGQTTLGLL